MPEFEKKEKELLKKLFLYPVVLSLFSVFLTGVLIFAIIVTYEKKDASKTINVLIKLKKEYIRNKVLNLSRDIDNTLKLSEEKTKKDVKTRVENLYYQLLSIERLPLKSKKKIAIDYLNNLNKFLKNKYVFAYDAKSGIVYVHKIRQMIGKNTKTIITKSGESVYERNKKALKNGGFYETYFYKPGDFNKKYEKINYIKYIPSLNLVIGSGEYVKDVKNRLVKNILQRIMLKRYGKNNYFFVIRPDGILLAHPVYTSQIGKNVLNLKDKNGKYFIKEIILKAMSSKNGAFVTYSWINPVDKKAERKLTYVVYNKNLNGIIGSGLYYKQDIERFIQKERENLQKEFWYINISVFAVFVVVLFLALGVSYYFSKRLRNIFKVYNKKTKKLLEKISFEANHDSLTKVANRKYFNEKLREEFYRAKRYKTPLSVAMIDIDHFKKVNDIYGHEAGDRVLKKLTSFCNKIIRESDFFARWGGEEFMFIFPHTSLESALQICEKIKNELQNNSKIQNPIKFTISCGITELKEDDTIDTLLKRADEALYLAKENGRDRIEVI